MSKLSIQPFWRDLRPHLAYPLRPWPLTVIGVLSIAHLGGQVPLIGVVIELLAWVALYRYAFDCLRASADGQVEPPPVRFVIDDPLGWAQIWLQTMFFAANLIGFLALGPIVGVPVALLLALALPGAMITLATEENLIEALNPVRWLDLARRIGAAYFAVAGLQFLFNIAAHHANVLAIPFLPALVAPVVFHLILQAIVIVTFHLLGYLVWQHHEALGYEPASMRTQRLANAGPDDEILLEVEELVRDGDPDVARETIANHLRSNVGTEALHVQYRTLLASAGQIETQLAHGREWIGVLLAQDNGRRTVDVARECLELDPTFELSDPDQVARVARHAAASGATAVAVKLVSGFHRRYPGHRDIPRNYLLAARLLAERMGRVKEARALLDQLHRTYADHPLAVDIEKYRNALDISDTGVARVAS